MSIRFTRIRTAAVALCATAAVATVAASTAAAATGHPAHHHGPAASVTPVVIDCATKHQVKPSFYILACADAGALVSRMHWATWGGQAAFGSGTYNFRVCVPNCAQGKTVTFPILAALWQVRPLPGHRSVPYFTRLTLIFTGNRSYKAGGKKFREPQTLTVPLSAAGGAG